MTRDWRSCTLGDLVRERIILEIQDGNHGNDHPKASDYVSMGVPFLMARDLQGRFADTQNCMFIRREQAEKLRIGFAKPGDVLLSHKGTVGSVALVPEGFAYVMLTPQITYYRISDDGRLDKEYLLQYFKGPSFQDRLTRVSGQSTRSYIGITEQKRLPIVLPPFQLQRRIAAILRTWDEAIEKLEALRAAKERRFKAIAQRLLAPSRAIGRGIPQTNWAPTTLGDVFTERQDRNRGLGPDDVVTVGKYAIRKQSEHFTRSVASKDQSNYWIISPGDFVYDPMSAYYGAIGRYDNTQDGIVSPAYRVIRLKGGIDSDFMTHILRSHHIRFLLETRSTQGNKEGKRRLLQRDEFESIEFRLPPPAVQADIARTLADSQRDIALTEIELRALQRQKRGLMQKLLTGEWRVTC